VCAISLKECSWVYNHPRKWKNVPSRSWAFVLYLSSYSVCWFNMLAKSALLVLPSRRGTGGGSKERSRLVT